MNCITMCRQCNHPVIETWSDFCCPVHALNKLACIYGYQILPSKGRTICMQRTAEWHSLHWNNRTNIDNNLWSWSIGIGIVCYMQILKAASDYIYSYITFTSEVCIVIVPCNLQVSAAVDLSCMYLFSRTLLMYSLLQSNGLSSSTQISNVP